LEIFKNFLCDEFALQSFFLKTYSSPKLQFPRASAIKGLLTYSWFVLREKYYWLVGDGWFILREKYYWLVADKAKRTGR
jgi:hypothetical protein